MYSVAATHPLERRSSILRVTHRSESFTGGAGDFLVLHATVEVTAE